jgi:hypothetical protein
MPTGLKLNNPFRYKGVKQLQFLNDSLTYPTLIGHKNGKTRSKKVMKPVFVVISVIAPSTLKRIPKNYYLHRSVCIFKKFSGVKKENAIE